MHTQMVNIHTQSRGQLAISLTLTQGRLHQFPWVWTLAWSCLWQRIHTPMVFSVPHSSLKLSLSHCWLLTNPALCRSHADNHSCWEIMNVMTAMPRRWHFAELLPIFWLFHSFCLLFSEVPQDWEESCISILCKVLYSAPWTSKSLYIHFIHYREGLFCLTLGVSALVLLFKNWGK